MHVQLQKEWLDLESERQFAERDGITEIFSMK